MLMLVKSDVAIRNFQWEDLAAITDLYNYCQEYDQLEGRMTLAELQNEWRSPLYTPEQECTVVYSPEGKLIAYGYVERGVNLNKGWGGAVVHPDYRSQGIGTHLLRYCDESYVERVAGQIEAETPLYIQRWTPESKTDAIELLQREGYKQVRTFYTMRINFDAPLESVVMPDGFIVKPFNPETDAFKVYEAQQEAFRDHWGHDADYPYEDWRTRITDPVFDASLWFIAYAGDEVAGVSLCNVWGEDIPDLGWVGTLGVRRPYRKHGLATALLKHSFYEFQQRGFKKVGLGVDASNPTGAVALYERAGMHVHKRGLSFRKVFRGNPDLIKD